MYIGGGGDVVRYIGGGGDVIRYVGGSEGGISS